MRGKVADSYAQSENDRITPAYAGKSFLLLVISVSI